MDCAGQLAELVGRARTGDEDAIGGLLCLHAADVRGVIGRALPRRRRSALSEDDVLQQTWVDAFCDFQAFVATLPREGERPAAEDHAALGRWLVTLARRNLVDALRMLDAEKRGGRRGQVGLDGVLVARAGGASRRASRVAVRMEASGAVLAAVRGLPERYREVVMGYDLEGRSMAEVAERIGASRGAAYMLRARALRALRSALGSSSRLFPSSA
jgi:RNA polymerase sigma factor (sigma-70 family)